MSGRFDDEYQQSEPAPGQPIPITPRIADAGEYPLQALGPKLEAAALAMIDKTQAPAGIAANSVLAAAALAVQPYIDIQLPTGEVVPSSLFMITVAESGERKSSLDKLALRAVRQRESEMREDYALLHHRYSIDKAAYEGARKKATSGTNKSRQQIAEDLERCGAEPMAPMQPLIVSDEGTLQGLQKLYADASPSLGLFSDEGGQWLGGHSMSEENRGQTGAGLSKLWDGSPIKRVRAGDITTFLPGRRLSLHLMIQGSFAKKLFGDPVLKSQGLLSRLLICQPRSTKGGRFWRDPDANSDLELDKYSARIYKLLSEPMPMNPETRELRPTVIGFTPEARAMWIAFVDAVESDLAPDGKLEEISGFAAKLPEHAARIAAVITFIMDRTATMISDRALANGIILAKFYADEALRVIGIGTADEDTENASTLIAWIKSKGLRVVGKRFLSLNAQPRSLRPAPVLTRAIDMLVEHRHLHKMPEGGKMAGDPKHYRDAYTVNSDDEQ
ncbi:YfjI family protein [Sphingomonas sp. MMS24-J13]|uniref:YfjI family protein n=1 Tax=Sphingomonas sp. MMS24-J13 TaxID=3238686 RepID=UPI00385008DC